MSRLCSFFQHVVHQIRGSSFVVRLQGETAPAAEKTESRRSEHLSALVIPPRTRVVIGGPEKKISRRPVTGISFSVCALWARSYRSDAVTIRSGSRRGFSLGCQACSRQKICSAVDVPLKMLRSALVTFAILFGYADVGSLHLPSPQYCHICQAFHGEVARGWLL